MRSRLVGALAAIALVAATSLDLGVARADVMPIHRGLLSDGFGEPDSGGGTRSLPIFFSMYVPSTGQNILIAPSWACRLPSRHLSSPQKRATVRQRTRP
jgi:hypothetical protein